MKSKIIALALAFLTLFPLMGNFGIHALDVPDMEIAHELLDSNDYEYVIYYQQRTHISSGYLYPASIKISYLPKGTRLRVSTDGRQIYENYNTQYYAHVENGVLGEFKLNSGGSAGYNDFNASNTTVKTESVLLYSSSDVYYGNTGNEIYQSKKPVADSAQLMEKAKTKAVAKMGESLMEDFGTISVVGGLIFGTLFLVALVRRLTLLGNH